MFLIPTADSWIVNILCQQSIELQLSTAEMNWRKSNKLCLLLFESS